MKTQLSRLPYLGCHHVVCLCCVLHCAVLHSQSLATSKRLQPAWSSPVPAVFKGHSAMEQTVAAQAMAYTPRGAELQGAAMQRSFLPQEVSSYSRTEKNHMHAYATASTPTPAGENSKAAVVVRILLRLRQELRQVTHLQLCLETAQQDTPGTWLHTCRNTQQQVTMQGHITTNSQPASQ